METDKATMELESYEDGTLLHIGPQAGESVPVDGVLAIIGKQGEDISGLLSGANGGTAAPEAAAPKADEAPKAEAKPEAAPAAAPSAPAAKVYAEVIKMPKMSDTMQEGTIVAWHKRWATK